MTKNWSPAFLLISLFVLIASALTISKVGRQSKARRLQVETDSLVYNKWKLPRWPAETWCEPPVLPRLDYKKCDRDGIINIIPLTGGLTNALKIILLSALYSL
eukprot:CAMPEP_0202472660 /NCGR_PEP_ID=MMETSP1360-20130828/88511_1 /ASSEMBLY_ACC=CAM_ASM_000848 /TAXON_ID=515479 /ORGANISM="Licmophora paradoxa, Strain CCMP2313" /LENGTH=102 /DNA_ID=CAMNT_0049099247 /DNA_START=13 /DNA_END=318 /DNA_ORIENTATION=+